MTYNKRLTSGVCQIVENEYPWLCSLTYNNNHICGITLLSGPPHATILAGAAHCYSPGDSPSSYRVAMSTVYMKPKVVNFCRNVNSL